MDPVQIADEKALQEALARPRFLLFKHSLVCPISARAFNEYRHFLAETADVHTAWIDVIGQRPLSLWFAEHAGVTHQSPQALVMSDGAVAWSASHASITRDSLSEAWEA